MGELQSAGKESGRDREPRCGTPLLPGQAHVGDSPGWEIDSWWRLETGTEANARLSGNPGSAWRPHEMELQPWVEAPKPQCPTVQPSWKILVRKGASLVLTANGPEAQPGDWYRWKHNGTEVKSRERLSVDGRTLRFSQVTQADGGIWVCNLYRQGHEEDYDRYHVEISVQPSEKISIRKGASLVLTVSWPEAQPGDWYRWTHNGTEVKSGERLSVDGRTLRFSRVTQADGGTWICNLYRRGHEEFYGSYHVEISGVSSIGCFERMAAFLSRQAMLLSLLALVFLLILAAIGLIYQRNKINQLDQSYNSLLDNYSQLDRDYNSLHGNFSLLNQSYNSLRANNSQLDRDHYSLHGNCSLLNQSYNEMREKNKQLDREHNKTLDGVRRLFNTLIERGCDPCPTGWELFNNRTCYFFSKDEHDWHSANDSCNTNNATLVMVTRQDQQNFIVDHDDDKRWIGLTDLEGVRVFRWLNGDLLNTGFWAFGEPNNFGVERCVTKGARYDTIKWNNDLCTTPHRWICEKPLRSLLGTGVWTGDGAGSGVW